MRIDGFAQTGGRASGGTTTHEAGQDLDNEVGQPAEHGYQGVQGRYEQNTQMVLRPS
jgi:hypothetical protein